MVVVVEDFAFHFGDVDLVGAFGAAAFAGEAEVEGGVEIGALEGAGAEMAGEGEAKEVGAAASGVDFVAGGLVGGAHEAAVGLAADAEAGAGFGGGGEAAFGGPGVAGV